MPVRPLTPGCPLPPQDNELDKLLHIMGHNLKDFLYNLDYLHAHLQVLPAPREG
jgi:hypothetical protein